MCAVKDQASLHICADSPEPFLLTYVITTELSLTDANYFECSFYHQLLSSNDLGLNMRKPASSAEY